MQAKDPLLHYQKKFEALDQWKKDRNTEFAQFKEEQKSHNTQMEAETKKWKTRAHSIPWNGVSLTSK